MVLEILGLLPWWVGICRGQSVTVGSSGHEAKSQKRRRRESKISPSSPSLCIDRCLCCCLFLLFFFSSLRSFLPAGSSFGLMSRYRKGLAYYRLTVSKRSCLPSKLLVLLLHFFTPPLKRISLSWYHAAHRQDDSDRDSSSSSSSIHAGRYAVVA